MPEFPNQYQEPRKPSPGEKEVVRAGWGLMLAKAIGVPFPKGKQDEAAFERVGVLLSRWFRNKFSWLQKKKEEGT